MLPNEPGTISTFRGERLCLPSSLDQIEGLRHRYADFLSKLNISPEATSLWLLVLTEAVVNAIRHGCQNDARKQIEVAWWVEANGIHVEVVDPGQGPPASISPSADLPDDPWSTDGRGRYLIECYVDERLEWRSPSGYRLHLRKNHPEIVNTEVEANEKILEQTIVELSACYESLAAFYRLGEGLAETESVSRFILDAMKDLGKAVLHQKAWLSFDEFADEVVNQENHPLDQLVPMHSLCPAENLVFQNDRELIWDVHDDSTQPPIPGFLAGACCPIHARGQALGVITLVREHGPGFSAGELNTLRTFADILGIAVLNAANAITRRREALALRELEIASELQNKLLPPPSVTRGKGWRVTTRREGAREVSGDYVDVVTCPNGDTILAMVDVMGKGVPAAFLAAIFRTTLHISLTSQHTLVELMSTLNHTLNSQLGDFTMFATCALIRIPKALDSLEVVNAGHCPVLIISPDGTIAQILASAPPLGLFPDIDYKTESRRLSPNEKVFLVTDGLYEWQYGDNIWGLDNLYAFLRENAALPGETIWQLLHNKIFNSQTGHDENRDDRTFLCWERDIG